ncbi:MAG: transporter, partial [Pseudomonadota bacterium]
VGDGIIVDGGATGEIEQNSGFGDLTLGVNYNVPAEITGNWLVQLQGRLKIPTANEDQGLGTGEVDGGVAVDVAYSFGNFTPFTTVGFRWRGDPEGADLNNTFNVSVGGSYNLGNGYALLASYDFREETVDTAEESQEVFGAITGPVTDQLRWTLYGSVGFTDGAPDGGVGAQLIWRPEFRS